MTDVLMEFIDVDPPDLIERLHKCGITNAHIYRDRDHLVEESIRRIATSDGFGRFLRRSVLVEAVLPKGKPRSVLVAIVRGMLDNLKPAQDVVIVDPYLLPQLQGAAASAYLDDLETALEGVVPSVATVSIVTKPNYSAALFGDLENRLKALHGGLRVGLKTTDEFHDRFWIADRARGLFIGTSFNGIGRRYALADRMTDNDTAEIVTALSGLGLI